VETAPDLSQGIHAGDLWPGSHDVDAPAAFGKSDRLAPDSRIVHDVRIHENEYVGSCNHPVPARSKTPACPNADALLLGGSLRGWRPTRRERYKDTRSKLAWETVLSAHPVGGGRRIMTRRLMDAKRAAAMRSRDVTPRTASAA